ncbi:MAG: YraN family protein [Fimbriimonadaceae bacterium]|nr:YraN family protein [Fimbriimonadaceae bacterium]
MPPRRLGAEAEDRAADYLLTLGYTLLKRRYKARRGEIDVVALDGDTVVFVEVKHRTSGLVAPEAAITATKRARLAAAARQYLDEEAGPSFYARHDLVAIDAEGLRHYINVFQ